MKYLLIILSIVLGLLAYNLLQENDYSFLIGAKLAIVALLTFIYGLDVKTNCNG